MTPGPTVPAARLFGSGKKACREKMLVPAGAIQPRSLARHDLPVQTRLHRGSPTLSPKMASVDSGRGDDVLMKGGGRKNAALAAVCVALSLSVAGAAFPSASHADMVIDQYGVQKQRICPVAYFPCWQEGQFCFRPIYCEGQFSPEGSLNALIIFSGILGPAYSIWRRKAGLDPDPNTPEGLAEIRARWKLKKQAKSDGEPKQLSKFFGKKKPTDDEAQ